MPDVDVARDCRRLDPDSEASRLVNGRELTADDVVYSYQRQTAQGDFTEPPAQAGPTFNLPWESIEATDRYTVVMKLTEPYLDALQPILGESQSWILPRDVIEHYGNYEDWKNVVGTGPLILTEYVEGVSKTFTRNPDFWDYDEKYPENRLPYVDEIRAPLMAEEATRISALRTGKIDIIQHAGVADIGNMDVIRSIQRTNPEIEVYSYYQRAFQVFTLNIRNAPFDDVRVRHALQMALDLETIDDTYFGGFSDWENPSWISAKGHYTPI
ncbi:MAG: ABC transporter substrate-binding protein [Spirochaetaceae bacterium]|nr:ABC transporter substrate-binding protein [Spirochaetaceae bacterium]